MEIITNRYRRETGKSAYKHNWFGKRIHNQDYVDWLEKQCTIHVVTQQSELVCDCLPMSTQVSTINGRYICCTCNKPLLSQTCG